MQDNYYKKLMTDFSQTPRHINQILDEIHSKLTDETSTVGLFMDTLHERGFGILIFIFALPMAIPLPVPPGVNLLFAAPLVFLCAQQIIGRKTPWLPEIMRKRHISPDKIKSIIKTARPFMGKISYFIRPRLGTMTRGFSSHMIGVFGVLFALCVSIPIPMTNTIPSFAILLMALGVLMRDGLAIIGGILIGSAWITILATIGITGLKALIGYIMGVI